MGRGGAYNCTQCKKMCNYGHKCPACKKPFHTICMLSLNNGDGRICITCFEASKIDVAQLDAHDHAPYSPSNLVPFHPFTKRYKKTVVDFDGDDSADSNWSADEDAEKKQQPKKQKQSKQQTKKAAEETEKKKSQVILHRHVSQVILPGNLLRQLFQVIFVRQLFQVKFSGISSR